MSTHDIALENKACTTCLALAVMLEDHPHYDESYTLQYLSEDRFVE